MTNEQELIQQEGNTIAYYLAKGFSPEMAEYYASGVKRPVEVVAQDDFTLLITFDNGEVRQLDVKYFVFSETVFEPFRIIENFRRVYIDEDGNVSWDMDPNVDSSVVWDNKVYLCPDYCYMGSTLVPA